MKAIYWAGSSLNDISVFPVLAKQEAGYQLHRIQMGQEPTNWKPMKTVGAGVKEIRIEVTQGIFRVLYVTEIASRTVVLHAFQKKTQATRKADIDLAKQRLKDVLRELK